MLLIPQSTRVWVMVVVEAPLPPTDFTDPSHRSYNEEFNRDYERECRCEGN